MPRVEASPIQGLGGLDLAAQGLPPEAAVLQLYAQSARRPPPPAALWRFCHAFLFFKNAVITQGVAARLRRGVASSPFAALVAQLPPLFADKAADFLLTDDHSTPPLPPLPLPAAAARHDSRRAAFDAVVFDVGGVLTRSPLTAIARWEAERGLPPLFTSAVLGSRGQDSLFARVRQPTNRSAGGVAWW